MDAFESVCVCVFVCGCMREIYASVCKHMCERETERERERKRERERERVMVCLCIYLT